MMPISRIVFMPFCVASSSVHKGYPGVKVPEKHASQLCLVCFITVESPSGPVRSLAFPVWTISRFSLPALVSV